MPRSLLAIAVLLAVTSAVLASSGGFTLSATGIELGKGEEPAGKDAPGLRYTTRAEVGKPFTIIAQGLAFGRGDTKGSAFESSGKWTFDEKAFKKGDPARKATLGQIPVTLTPTTAGTSRIRFAGEVLGYKRTIEVIIEVAEGKKK